MTKFTATQRVAREICRAVSNDCVMDGDPNKERCNEANCRIYLIAAAALDEAARSGPNAGNQDKKQ